MVSKKPLPNPVLLLVMTLLLVAAVRADFAPPKIQPDSYKSRLSQKKQQLRDEGEQLVARQDQLYNEITQVDSKTSFLRQYGWMLLIFTVLAAVILRLALEQRGRRLARNPRPVPPPAPKPPQESRPVDPFSLI